ncbi:class I fructose-bisphosphate aldolase [Jiella sonneratiae]|uniref:fructose-bisphosphate aldolase n=1 Tax=Jiella sonneratiae TaxID=2816856 RepID=A0ABS3IZN3_9HYPH|nr:class I fructose-bisphosphate aldolase [Jiella sonneratiae]MBO0902879.1 class I fructose-bisphosphate aldolase [Jiella sonneratiae]
MHRTEVVRNILSWYEGETPGLKSNLSRLLMHGRLGGTGRMVILPVDQGFEHGPARSFAPNPAAYDPHYLYELAIESGVSGYAAPLGLLEQGADTFAGEVPLILKVNSGNSLVSNNDQALTGTVDDAMRLGCIGVGFTIYPGSECSYDMIEELRDVSHYAKSRGLISVVWSYPRGGKVTKDGETGTDIIAYAAHMAALMGATIIKVKLPTAHIDLDAAKSTYEKYPVDSKNMAGRVKHVMQAAFNGKRVVVFSGGAAKNTPELLEEVRAIREGGGNGSIIGRNSFQRPKEEAIDLLNQVMDIYA